MFAAIVTMLVIWVVSTARAAKTWPPSTKSFQQARWDDYQLLQSVRGATEVYAAEYGVLPPNLAQLSASPSTSPWAMGVDCYGNPLAYTPAPTSDGRPFNLCAMGPDSILNTSDDVSAWEVPK